MRVNAIFLAQPPDDGVTPWCWPHQAVESAKTLAVIDHFGVESRRQAQRPVAPALSFNERLRPTLRK